uniref:Uncharacterized protein n=1 Tax=Mycena chlorophos TaxID=658473 RepID=A0ABQ0LXR1_MYCCL|nr:predicted protein [Mycena chlorophos]
MRLDERALLRSSPSAWSRARSSSGVGACRTIHHTVSRRGRKRERGTQFSLGLVNPFSTPVAHSTSISTSSNASLCLSPRRYDIVGSPSCGWDLLHEEVLHSRSSAEHGRKEGRTHVFDALPIPSNNVADVTTTLWAQIRGDV